MNNEIIKETEEFAYQLLHENSPSENIYHNATHTREVVDACYEIANAEKINEEELELLIVAAWLHDIGYTEKCEGHEEVSVEKAREFLTDKKYPAEKIEKVSQLIMATKVPQKPDNHLEEIICDADLHHLGKKGFMARNELFRSEREKKMAKKFDDVKWHKKNMEFFRNHTYFTRYARDNFEERKLLNLIKIEKQLKKDKQKAKTNKIKDEKLELERKKIEEKKKKSSVAERGIETMFRNSMRTHVEFSGMADTKANIMISVNTLILTVVVAILARKLDSNPHFIIPTLILTIISMTTLIYAVMVTRPQISEGKFSKEDIKNKKANLLFFGNFYRMEKNDFVWGMKEVINDRNYLYDSMITDFYYLGQVLGKKYRYLRICYSIFMYGLMIAVLAFAIAVFLYPQGIKTDTDGKVKVEQSEDKNHILDILE